MLCRLGIRVAWGLIKMRIGVEFRAIIDEIVEDENQKAKAALPPPPPAPPPRRMAKKSRFEDMVRYLVAREEPHFHAA